MTLKTQMTTDVSTVLLNTNDHAATIQWYPKGRPQDVVDLKAIVSSDDLEGTREAHGDGRILHSIAGTNMRETIQLTILQAGTNITAVKGAGIHAIDQFKVEGKMYSIKRIMGRGDGSQRLLCVRTEVNTTRRGERRG